MSIESVMPSNHLTLCHPLLLPPSVFPSIRVFSNESVLCIRWPKYWSFNFSISPSNEYSGLISFTMDWLALLAVQGTLKSLLQHSFCFKQICVFQIKEKVVFMFLEKVTISSVMLSLLKIHTSIWYYFPQHFLQCRSAGDAFS